MGSILLDGAIVEDDVMIGAVAWSHKINGWRADICISVARQTDPPVK